MNATARRRSWWGWGWADQALDDDAARGLATLLADRFATPLAPLSAPADPATTTWPDPRVELPSSLAHLGSTAPEDRVRHGRGNSYREVVRAQHADVPNLPDLVVRPIDADDVERLLDWAGDAGVRVVPYGGGSSVVGGVTPSPEPTISLDLERLDRVLHLDPVSQAAQVQAGALGPRLEEQLRPAGLTLRFYPQSFEFSTVGGWLATRAGGHFATGPTHIDDLVESIAAVTPRGRWRSRRLPASGAGPSPDRMLLGSEGTLGVITDAWLRVQRRPTARGRATVAFADEASALDAVRALLQAGHRPANCRLLDPVEAATSGAAPPEGTETLLVLGLEAVDTPLDDALQQAVTLLRDHGARIVDDPETSQGDRSGTSGGGAGAWRSTFLQGPYLRDALARSHAVVETFETAVTWDRAAEAIATLRQVATDAAQQACGAASVAVRTTHAYPDGIAPYLTVVAPGSSRPGREGAREAAAAWDRVKEAVGEAIDDLELTATHHHAVGRDHRPVYDRQRPEPFALALGAAKAALDPHGILNPGVLLGPPGNGPRPSVP